MAFPGVHVTIVNQTGREMACWYNATPGSIDTTIPIGDNLPIAWIPGLNTTQQGMTIEAKPWQQPQIHVRVVPGDGTGWKVGIYRHDPPPGGEKWLDLRVPNDAAQPVEVWVEIYADGDFWIRRPGVPFGHRPAEVTFTVTNFVEVAAATTATLQLTANPDSVRVKLNAAKTAIRVGGQADLRFKVRGPAGEIYKPMAVLLKRTDGQDQAGWETFSSYRLLGDSITFRDEWTNHGPGSRYKYFILVQKPDGTMGLIDPEVENETAEEFNSE